MRLTFLDNLLFTERPDGPEYDLQPHLGLLSLMGASERAGHHCRLVDPKVELHYGRATLAKGLYRSLAQAVLETEPEIVGLTSLGCNFVCTLKVARHLKAARPDLPILIGGPHATILHQEILGRFSEFDLVVRGEGEVSLPLVLESLGTPGLRGIQGIAFRAGTEIVATPPSPIIEDLDSLPSTDYSHHPVEELGLKTLRIEAGRGCPFQCTFCSTASFFGRRFRLKSARRLRDEMLALRARYGVTDFGLMHDLFTVNKAKVYEFCDAVAGRGLTWSCSARVDCVDNSLLHRMFAAGCRAIYYGIETGSQRMQEVSLKRLDLSLFDPILETTLSLGMSATASFIVGYPEETQADQDGTLDRIGACWSQPSDRLDIQLHLLTPEPGTRMHREHRTELQYDGYIADFNFPTLEVDDEDIMRSSPDIFVNHHFYPSQVDRARNIFVTEFFTYLHALGGPTISHILARHPGGLSRLIAELFRRHLATGKTGKEPPVLLQDYVDEIFGSRDYLTSLVRYATAANRLLTMPDRVADGHEASIEGRALFQLSDRAIVLRNLHDVPAILSLPPGPSDSIGGRLAVERDDWLICADSSSARTIQNYRLAEGTSMFLDYIRRPRSLGDCRRFGQGTGAVRQLVAQLAKMGAIQVLRKEREDQRPARPASGVRQLGLHS